MIRTIACAGFVLLAGIASSGTARAQNLVVGVDGCAILASIVFTEVTEARLGFSTGSSRDLLYAGRNEITVCNEATRSVTGAFAAALRQANVYVTWGFHTGYRGDYCLSHFLSQCYPTGDPAMPPMDKRERSFVMRSWQAVQDSLYYRMAPHPGGDVVRFDVDDLGLSIRRFIAASRHENPSQLLL